MIAQIAPGRVGWRLLQPDLANPFVRFVCSKSSLVCLRRCPGRAIVMPWLGVGGSALPVDLLAWFVRRRDGPDGLDARTGSPGCCGPIGCTAVTTGWRA